jgi:hypothetical protein
MPVPNPNFVHEFAAAIATGLTSNGLYIRGVTVNDDRYTDADRKADFAKLCYDLAEALMAEGANH